MQIGSLEWSRRDPLRSSAFPENLIETRLFSLDFCLGSPPFPDGINKYW